MCLKYDWKGRRRARAGFWKMNLLARSGLEDQEGKWRLLMTRV
jgi:hypothetical protein